jgi:hypothetical protein
MPGRGKGIWERRLGNGAFVQQLSPDGQRILRIALGSLLTVPLAVFIVALGDDLGHPPAVTVPALVAATALAVALGVWWELRRRRRAGSGPASSAALAGGLGAGLLCGAIISESTLLLLCAVLMVVMVAAMVASIVHFVTIARDRGARPGP